jgi:glycosyltransferase involved in cell wall biosynthesis
MRILLINQFFWPDSAATSQLLTDLARSLARRGHQVNVICGNGSYAETDPSDAPPATVTRVRSLPFGRNPIIRILSYASFVGTAAWRGLRSKRPDVVITLTTPPLVSTVGTLLKWIRGSRHFIWEMDVYPDVAIDLGYIDGRGAVARMVGLLADLSRSRSDGVIALGDCMRNRLIERGIPAAKIEVAENWADAGLFDPSPVPPGGSVKVLYSGNLGLAHDVETISSTMLTLKDDQRFEFIFAGGGSRRKALENWCAENSISNASFRPYCGLEELGRSLSEASVGLVTQKAECLGSVVPSKTYGLMAAARPILFVGPRAATPSILVNRHSCGWQVDCGDHRRLTGLLLMLAANPGVARRAGARGREAFLQNYDHTKGVERICRIIGAAGSERRQNEAPANGRQKLSPKSTAVRS